MEKINEQMKMLGEKFSKSKALVWILCILGIAIIAKLIFSAGVIVGFQRASFGSSWEENYMNNFGMAASGRGLSLGGDYLPNSHGATGKIISIEPPNILVHGDDNTEKVVLINTDTKLQKGRTIIMYGDLHINDYVISIGAPGRSGIIEAKFIRVIPRPEILIQ